MKNSIASGATDASQGSESAPRESLSWYALYVRSRHEKVVEESLKGKGYLAFSPSYKVRRRRVDRTVDLELPLFPSYVFCQFDALHRLPILQTPGVVFIVSCAGESEPVDAKQIDAIRVIATSGRPVRPWAFLRSGQKVRVRAGALAGTEGIFLRVKNQNCLVASVTLLQRSVTVDLDQDQVEPIY